MKQTELPPSAIRVVDFLGDLGGRWGNPRLPCRVHGYLYLAARPAALDELCDQLRLDSGSVERALQWLLEFGLAVHVPPNRWRTESDPWNAMMSALEERRRRELNPALQLLRECREETAGLGTEHRAASLQIGRLLSLVEDLAAIDTQSSRLSADSLRQFVRVAARAARFFDRSLSKERRR